MAEQENRALLSPEKSPPTTPQSTSSRSPPSGSKRGVRGRHMSGIKISHVICRQFLHIYNVHLVKFFMSMTFKVELMFESTFVKNDFFFFIFGK